MSESFGALHVERAAARFPTGAGPAKASPGSKTFAGALSEATDQIRVSQHATRRLASRQIELSERDLVRLGQAADQAAAKGARDSLVVMDGLGLIVNVPNRTVVTALDVDRMETGMVTNIDSTIFLEKR